ncbi:winged helix-turn-helix domain-containing protein [Sphingomonas sp. UNC305MFCol5.2]|uniref:winged helix-turn-helix domain-containing protein n=1 Tax=Sphingomonas sp. UNC305MFCol5.2 TaxID=1449076 RepID=UPI0009DFC74A|nr:transcriptional regulator [Sphingomonas sp. UNC305MFCol5.2]
MPTAAASEALPGTTRSPEHASSFDQAVPAQRCFAFGPFLLRPEQQLLLKREAPVRIGGRALDILTALVEKPGELVDKRTLISRVWPNIYVEETNLKVNVAGLRRALEDDPCVPRFIATVVGRGYRFIAPVRATASPAPASDRHPSGEVPSLVELIETINAVRRHLAQISSPGR